MVIQRLHYFHICFSRVQSYSFYSDSNLLPHCIRHADEHHKVTPSRQGIKKMRQFYEEWAPSIRPPMAVDLEVVDYECLLTSRQPLKEEINFEKFVSLSFTHHIEIMNKAKKLEERLFYIHEAVTNKWDNYLLRDMLKGISGGERLIFCYDLKKSTDVPRFGTRGSYLCTAKMM